jgi:hypothetical protein
MTLNSRIFLITSQIVFLFYSDLLQAQIVIVPKNQIGAAVTGRALGNSIKNLNNLAVTSSEIERLLEDARKEYWNPTNFSTPYIPPLKYQGKKEVEQRYIELLYTKDMSYFLFDAFNRYDPLQSNTRRSNSGVNGVGDAIMYLMSLMKGGGLNKNFLDHGINKSSINEFDTWAFKVHQTWGKTASSLLDYSVLLKAIDANTDSYWEYVKKRDESEFYYKNPYSPLKGDSPDFLLHAVLVNSGVEQEVSESLANYQYLVKRSQKKAVDDALINFRNNIKGELNKDAVANLYWELAKSSKELFALFQIKRKYGISWQKAGEIFDRRVKRYGIKKVERCVEIVWNEKDSPYSVYPTSPDLLGKASVNQRGVFNPNEDFTARILGENTLWFDLLDWGAQEINMEITKKEYINTQLNGDANLYISLTKYVIDENILLISYFLNQKYGLLFFKSERSYITTDMYSVPEWSVKSYTELLGGLAIGTNNCKTMKGLIAWNMSDNYPNFSIEVLEILKKNLENTDCDYLMKINRFDEERKIYEGGDNCTVMHPQSLLSRKLCATSINEKKVDTIKHPEYFYFEDTSRFKHYKIFSIRSYMSPPDVPGCDSYDKTVCSHDAIGNEVSYFFRKELARLTLDPSNYPIFASFTIDPDGSLTPLFISKKNVPLQKAFVKSLAATHNYGGFRSLDVPIRVDFNFQLLKP